MISNSEENENVVVSLEVVWGDSARKYDARLSEVGIKGGHIDCLTQSSVGEVFDFKVRVPSGHWVSFKGEVTYSDYPMGFGFKFVNLSENNRKLLAEIITAHGGKVTQEFSKEPTSDEWQVEMKKSRILVADDDPLTLRMLTAIIESQNYLVVTAQDGREAFRILQTDDNFNAAIFDMMMPHLDGLDLIHYMKTDDRLSRIPIGMITAEQDPKIWKDSVAAGASVFLPKPFSPPQVQMMINMLSSKLK